MNLYWLQYYPLTLPLSTNDEDADGTGVIKSTVKSTVNSTVNHENTELTAQQERILNLMINNPGITIEEIADKIGKDRNAVNYQLKKMKAYIKIERIGSDKNGQWNISIP